MKRLSRIASILGRKTRQLEEDRPLVVVISYAMSPQRLIDSVTPAGIALDWHIHYHGPDPSLARTLHQIARTRDDITLFDHRRNRGLAKSWNESLSRLNTEANQIAFLINDDLYFKDNGFKTFYEFILEHENHKPRTPAYYSVFGDESGHNAAGATYHQGMACCALNARMYRLIGPFDERFVPAYYEDSDYFRRIDLAGIETIWDRRILCTHERSATTRLSPKIAENLDVIIQRNRSYYVAKWGGEPGQEVFTEPFDGASPPKRTALRRRR